MWAWVTKILKYISITFFSVGLGFLHMYHVSTLFEHDRHFSHLSELEREMTFRTEMGFYYHYYKTIIQAPSFEQGLQLITRDNMTEYPSVINAVERFNIYPEIIIGGLFRLYDRITMNFNIVTTQCWEVSRGATVPSVISCEGLGDPIYFYLEFVWYAAGMTKAILFLYAVTLSDSPTGGLITILGFIYNHSHCTRIQWTPPLRESFAYPFCLLQFLTVTYVIKQQALTTNPSKFQTARQVIKISVTTLITLLIWQFSQFVIATQTGVIIVMYSCGLVTRNNLLVIMGSQLLGLFFAFIFMFGNELLFQSVLFSLLISTLPIIVITEEQLPIFTVRCFVIPTIVYVFFAMFKAKIGGIFGAHDAHVLNILKAKFSSFKNFHTMLYTCSAEFDFLPFETITDLCKTLLIPTSAFVLLCVCYKFMKCCCDYKLSCSHIDKNYSNNENRKLKEKEKEVEKFKRNVSPEVIYNVLQVCVFTAMALLIMRLKLFWTPHMCILTSLFVSDKYCVWPRKGVRTAIVIGLLAVMSFRGIQNVVDQHNVLGEYYDIPLENVLKWIKHETKTTDVFAGSMSIMPNVLLSTRRPIVNHPHYEHWKMRDRTVNVYSVFSRQSPDEVFHTLAKLGVDYVVLDEASCFPRSRRNCSMIDLWDTIDVKNRNNAPLCPRLFSGNPAPFRKVFSNDAFVVLSVKARQYVEIVANRSFSM